MSDNEPNVNQEPQNHKPEKKEKRKTQPHYQISQKATCLVDFPEGSNGHRGPEKRSGQEMKVQL